MKFKECLRRIVGERFYGELSGIFRRYWRDLPKSFNETRAAGGNSWFNLQQLNVEGRGWNDTKDFYDRLPARAEGVVRPLVWDLSRNSAGLCARFVTDATTIRARWSLTDRSLHVPNMTAIGKSGLDLYVKMETGWRWLAVGVPENQTNEVALVKDLVPGKREYL